MLLLSGMRLRAVAYWPPLSAQIRVATSFVSISFHCVCCMTASVRHKPLSSYRQTYTYNINGCGHGTIK